MRIFCLSIVLVLCFVMKSQAQEKCKFVLITSVFSNSTALPTNGLPGTLHAPLHPGMTIGLIKDYKKTEKHQLYQTYRLGYFYQRYVQHAIQLYSEFGYRFNFKNGFGLFSQLGAGYVHSFQDQEKFILKDGEYKKQFPIGRPQLMISFAPGLSYDLSKKCGTPLLLFVNYQIWFQLPFVRQYVPVLPNSSLHVGAIISLNKKGQ
ncbi:MAG TPA: hypothetical protein VNW99_11330 [Cytophagaceae bacterium]|jgi:hypothetical protein|nr:hypothetical protein [Cytophagaceae bacterium]